MATAWRAPGRASIRRGATRGRPWSVPGSTEVAGGAPRATLRLTHAARGPRPGGRLPPSALAPRLVRRQRLLPARARRGGAPARRRREHGGHAGLADLPRPL